MVHQSMFYSLTSLTFLVCLLCFVFIFLLYWFWWKWIPEVPGIIVVFGLFLFAFFWFGRPHSAVLMVYSWQCLGPYVDAGDWTGVGWFGATLYYFFWPFTVILIWILLLMTKIISLLFINHFFTFINEVMYNFSSQI